MRTTVAFSLMLVGIALLIGGCQVTNVTNPPGNGSGQPEIAIQRGVSDALGALTLTYTTNPPYTESLLVRQSQTQNGLPGVQVFSAYDINHRIYLAFDPSNNFLPTVTSGSSDDASRVITLSPTTANVLNTTTRYLDRALLNRLVSHYYTDFGNGSTKIRATVANLGEKLAALANNRKCGLVLTTYTPNASYEDVTKATVFAQRSTDFYGYGSLPATLTAYDWPAHYSGQGVSAGRELDIWLLDPAKLNLNQGGDLPDSLADGFIAVVMPVTSYNPSTMVVELTWTQSVDLDLHLTRNYADLYDTNNDCFWNAKTHYWNGANSKLETTSTGYSGKERIVMDKFIAGDVYSIAVDYWGDSWGNTTDTPATCTVKVWINNMSAPVRSFTVVGFRHGEPQQGDYVVVCDIDDKGIVTTRNSRREATRNGGKSTGL